MSRTAGRTIYGKKKMRKNLKSKRDNLIDQMREDILRIKNELESKEEIRYHEKSISVKGYMKKFKASEGATKIALNALYREGYISGEYRGGIWYVNYDSDKRIVLEVEILEPLFNLKECPICGSTLKENKRKSHVTESYSYECSHNCFKHKYDHIQEYIYIYDDVWQHVAGQHNSIVGNMKKDIEKKIKFWKTKHRYVARNLLGEWDN